MKVQAENHFRNVSAETSVIAGRIITQTYIFNSSVHLLCNSSHAVIIRLQPVSGPQTRLKHQTKADSNLSRAKAEQTN